MTLVLEAIGKGLVMGVLLALSVGPVIFTVVKHSISSGKEGGFSFIAGVWLSDIFLVVLANLFTELLNHLLNFKSIIGIAGSGLLIAMGVYYLFFKKTHLHPEDVAALGLKNYDYARIGFQGFLLNTLNPAVMVFWLTAATAISVSHTIRDRILIFGTAIVFNICMDILKISLAEKLRKKLTPKNIKLVNKISGIVLLVFGAVLLISILFFIKRFS